MLMSAQKVADDMRENAEKEAARLHRARLKGARS